MTIPLFTASPPFTALLRRMVGLLLLLFFAMGCVEDEVCEEVTANPLRMGFYLLQDGQEESQAVIDSLSLYGVGRQDSMIYDNRRGVSRVEVPLDPTADACAFVLVFPGGVADTLFVQYARELHMVSVECGFVMHYMLQELSFGQSVIQQVVVHEDQVIQNPDEHLKIYIPPADPD